MRSSRFRPSAVGQSLKVFGITVSLQRDLRGRRFDLTEVIWRKLNFSRPDVLLKPVQLRGARNRHDPRLLCEQPSERDLSGRRLLPLRDLAEQINQRLIRLPCLRREAREEVAEVRAVEGRVLVHLACEEALAEWAVGHEADTEFLAGRNHFRLRPPPPERVFVLYGRDRLDGVRAADRLHSRFRETEVLDLALLNQLLHRARHVLNRHLRVNAVLIEQINRLDLEPPERAFDGLLDVLRLAVEAVRLCGEIEPELGGDYYLVAEGCECLAHEFFVRERAVNFGGVEEGDAALDCRPDQ